MARVTVGGADLLRETGVAKTFTGVVRQNKFVAPGATELNATVVTLPPGELLRTAMRPIAPAR
jgi:hypothetical protein